MRKAIAWIMVMFLGMAGSVTAADVEVLFVGDDDAFQREKLFGPVAKAFQGEGIKMTYMAFTKQEQTWRAPAFRTLLRNAIQWSAKKTGVALRG